MFRVNALFEAWLRESAEKPLASWKRGALLWRLQEDEELRCYALELAQFIHEAEPSKDFSPVEQAWMRERLQARLGSVQAAPADPWISRWAGPVIGLTVGLSILALIVSAPQPEPVAVVMGSSAARAAALTLPSPTSTVTPSPTAAPAAPKESGPLPTLTAVP
jgi:hypothetical protein